MRDKAKAINLKKFKKKYTEIYYEKIYSNRARHRKTTRNLQ